MTKEQLKAEMSYQVSRNLMQQLLSQGLISHKEYKKIDTKLLKKYAPILGSLAS